MFGTRVIIKFVEVTVSICLSVLQMEGMKEDVTNTEVIVTNTAFSSMIITLMVRFEIALFGKSGFTKGLDMTLTVFGAWMYSIGAAMHYRGLDHILDVYKGFISFFMVFLLLLDTMITWCTSSNGKFYAFHPMEEYREKLHYRSANVDHIDFANVSFKSTAPECRKSTEPNRADSSTSIGPWGKKPTKESMELYFSWMKMTPEQRESRGTSTATVRRFRSVGRESYMLSRKSKTFESKDKSSDKTTKLETAQSTTKEPEVEPQPGPSKPRDQESPRTPEPTEQKSWWWWW